LTAPRSFAGGLRISDPADAHEQEAERVADDVMTQAHARRHWSVSDLAGRSSLQRKCSCSGSSGADRECEECKKKERRVVAATQGRRPAGSGMAPPIVHDVLNASGQPLDTATRGYFEPRFGYDFQPRARAYGCRRTAIGVSRPRDGVHGRPTHRLQ
jgi:hypothetical protein